LLAVEQLVATNLSLYVHECVSTFLRSQNLLFTWRCQSH